MIWIATIVIVITLVIALIATIYILRNEENKANKYADHDNLAEIELKRSHEYETKSLTKNVKNLLWIYAIVIVLSFVALAIYIYQL
ncbi:hypothetical protein [Oceanobacillus bengalensis]|uniref:Uncharacterized protein n=1 Tax=Oceanobacillus bengalensis TaxID=1435466 RepID=A0A494Z3K2_9BACI|nr:hypothetical protein [Oceanobacillus bengalensis]RKQ17090.1 hypothetical protein D8M05_05305 [Oceanobacillus bengalensis]